MLTTGEAADRLGISSRRVVELIHNGSLEAQRHGGVWLISSESVERRLGTARPKGGRPARGEGRNELRFTLMNRTHPIIELVYDRARNEFVSAGELLDAQRAPIGIASGGTIRLTELNAWWRGRGIPGTRDGIERLLDEAGADVPEELVWRNLGLSLSDQYWISPRDAGLAWDDISFFTNSWERSSEAVSAFAPGAPGEAHPDNTSDGNLSKRWIRRGKAIVLQKFGSRLNQEPFNEVVATALHERLLAEGEYVRYKLAESDGAPVSECANFLRDREEFVPALYVRRTLPEQAQLDDYRHYLACCEALGVPDAQGAFAKMIVCDDVIANHDRHWRNFGIIRDVETLACRPAPLFDSGSSLWCNASLAALEAGDFSFESKPFFGSPARQLLLVEDFSWASEDAFEGFVEEAVGTLQANPMLSERLPHIRTGLERRVRRMIDIIEWS